MMKITFLSLVKWGQLEYLLFYSINWTMHVAVNHLISYMYCDTCISGKPDHMDQFTSFYGNILYIFFK